MTYKWKSGTRYTCDPQIAGEHLDQLQQAHNGELTPQLIVDSARAKTSPLHNDFEWNDSVAGEKYRYDQARRMVRCVLVTSVPDAPARTPAFVSVKIERTPETPARQFYMRTVEAMQDEERRQHILKKALEEAVRFRKRYQQYLELAALTTAIEEVELTLAAA